MNPDQTGLILTPPNLAALFLCLLGALLLAVFLALAPDEPDKKRRPFR